MVPRNAPTRARGSVGSHAADPCSGRNLAEPGWVVTPSEIVPPISGVLPKCAVTAEVPFLCEARLKECTHAQTNLEPGMCWGDLRKPPCDDTRLSVVGLRRCPILWKDTLPLVCTATRPPDGPTARTIDPPTTALPSIVPACGDGARGVDASGAGAAALGVGVVVGGGAGSVRL